MIQSISDSELSQVFDRFKAMQECAVCKKESKDSSIAIIDQHGASAVVHITCPHCKHAIIALVGTTQVGMGLIGLLTDLTFEDVQHFQGRAPLSEDDVLECYELLHTKGIFTHLQA